MSNAFYVSVIVPCFNERENIVPLIEMIHEALSFCRHQVVVVDDNSPDGTYKLVCEKKFSFVKPVLRTSDPSLAKSIRTGLENADGNVFVIMDSDFNHQPKYLPFMVKSLEFYPCVSGSRFVYGGKMDTRLRHILSWFFNIWVRVLTQTQVTDSLYGFVAIHRNVMEKTDYSKIFWGYGDYCIRLMYYLQKMGVEILQFPAVNGKRLKGHGNSNFIKVFKQYAAETLKLVFRELFSPTKYSRPG